MQYTVMVIGCLAKSRFGFVEEKPSSEIENILLAIWRYSHSQQKTLAEALQHFFWTNGFHIKLATAQKFVADLIPDFTRIDDEWNPERLS